MATSTADLLRADLDANRHDLKGLVLVVSYRVASEARRSAEGSFVRLLVVLPILIAYRLLIEWTLGVELPPKVQAGPGLRIRHGQGLVVNTGTVLGANVLLRHNVTIGNIRKGPVGTGPGETTACPVIGDGVEFGAGAVVIGPITVGDGARIGANAVVTTDVPPGATVKAPPSTISPARPPG